MFGLRYLISSAPRSMVPSSRVRVFSRLSVFDLVWACACPVLAFIIRDGIPNQPTGMVVYCAIAWVASAVSFQWFRVSDPISTFFSVSDAINITRACLTTVALTTVVLFIVTRLVEAPRSIPAIHFLVLTAGLVTQRILARLASQPKQTNAESSRGRDVENIIVVGATRVAPFFIKLIEEFARDTKRIVAVLDDRSSLFHRTLLGYPIIGTSSDLQRIVDEYATHGIRIGKVVVALNPAEVEAHLRSGIQSTCEMRGLSLEWLYQGLLSVPLGVWQAKAEEGAPRKCLEDQSCRRTVKRAFDLILATTVMLTIAPVTLVLSFIVLLDLGYPVIFWQQRVGLWGGPLRIYKFRTMRCSLNAEGGLMSDPERASVLGELLRRSRMDEIPQLLNIVRGDMSFVGPRPLLPVDQPKSLTRTKVKPGLTGLAQINGGKLLSTEEKEALDEWYVEHPSFWLDVWILLRTIWVVLRGDRRNEHNIAQALSSRKQEGI